MNRDAKILNKILANRIQQHIEESLHPWDKAHLVMMYDLFNMLLDSLF